jgi:acid phosphatase type 7
MYQYLKGPGVASWGHTSCCADVASHTHRGVHVAKQENIMHRSLFIVVVLCLIVLGLTPGVNATEQHCFDETGYCVDDTFARFWSSHGGLPVFGYPISNATSSPVRTQGHGQAAQWFERGRFESHPELRPPYNVLLGHVGLERLEQLGRDWRAEPREAGPRPYCLWFEETGRNVCDQSQQAGFRRYWETHGLEFDGRPGKSFAESLALFGLPLTSTRMETNVAGHTVLTQWFERARFEWHPQNERQHRVLLGLVAREAILFDDTPPPPPTPAPTATASPTASPTSTPTQTPGYPRIAGAGDIACNPRDPDFNGGNGTARLCRAKATSDLLLAGNYTAIFALGDNQAADATLADFQRSYDLSWGRLKHKTYPAVGNHEYATPGAAGYFDYFGAAAGERGKGYYSYNIGDWHIIVLNSNCSEVGTCWPGSPQERWLRADLAANKAKCTLAYWHHPRFSSTPLHGGDLVKPFWDALYEANAEIVLNGHGHNYERFAPQTPDGVTDPRRGIRQFVVGTGGQNFHGFANPPRRNSEVRDSQTYGILELTLRPAGYDWRFIPEPGGTFTDSGSGTCH